MPPINGIKSSIPTYLLIADTTEDIIYAGLKKSPQFIGMLVYYYNINLAKYCFNVKASSEIRNL